MSDAVAALKKLRQKLVSDQHDTEFRIATHLREYRHDFSVIDNKIWAVKDAKLEEHKARTMEIINIIDSEIRSYE